MMTDDGDVAPLARRRGRVLDRPRLLGHVRGHRHFLNATGALRPLLLFANVIEYEVETDGAYDWELFTWTGKKHIEIPRQRQAQQTPSTA